MREIIIGFQVNPSNNSWQKLPFSKYLEIINLEQTDDELTNSINLVAIMNDINVKEVEKMKAKDFAILANNLEFLKDSPDTSESKFTWKLKTIDNLTMDDFITYEAMKSDENNLPALLSMMSGIHADDIIKMSTLDVLSGFFLLQRMSERYIQHSARLLLWQITKEKLRRKFLFWRRK